MIKEPLTHRLWAKIAAMILLCIAGAALFASVIAGYGIYYMNFYTSAPAEATHTALFDAGYRDANGLAGAYQNGGAIEARRWAADHGIDCKLVDGNGVVRLSTGALNGNYTQLSYNQYYWDEDCGVGTVTVLLDNTSRYPERYALAAEAARIGYAWRYGVWGIAAASALAGLILFLFLLCAAGHRHGRSEIIPNLLDRLPFDLYCMVMGGVFFCFAALAWECLRYTDNLPEFALGIVCLLPCGLISMGWCMGLATRLKFAGWAFIKNSLVWMFCAWCWHLFLRILRAFGRLLRGLPLVRKTVLILAGLCCAEFVLMIVFWDTSSMMMLWFLERLFLVPIVLSTAVLMRRLQKGGEALAEGDLAYHIDTNHMRGDLLKHAENLNSIALGMNRAVEDRTKSERMKTELITNVSHDIKTPLTSIINYTDLISREECTNPKITEYCGVLQKHSERLKKLIEDLVEASKASSGNMEVNLAPCQAGVLLEQTVGEYQQRAAAAGLELVVKQPEAPVTIMADGRLLWRVFDNLMNNICKYAQKGTRVYLDLAKVDGTAQISFKNISGAALNISADELMERFVRGDASRSTEGHGLGLSIARSLTELQGGTLALSVDGDLFKVMLSFKTVE